MSCGSCAARVDKALSSVPGLRNLSVNLATNTAQFETDQTTAIADVLSALSEAGYPANTHVFSVDITGMHCGSCVARAEKAVTAVPEVVSAQVNLAANSAVIEVISEGLPQQTAMTALADAGYPATLQTTKAPRQNSEQHVEKQNSTKRNFLIALALTLPVFILEMGSHLFPAFHHMIHQTIGVASSWWIQFCLTTLVLAGPGRDFFRLGSASLIKRQPDMNALVALGAGSAWLFSTCVLIAPNWFPAQSRAVYFEAAAVIVVLILLGRWLEARAKGRTGAAIRALIDLQPPTAEKIVDSLPKTVPLQDLALGDHILIRPGARIPADAVITKGESYVDESMMTGEPIPVRKDVSDKISAGTVNGEGSLMAQVLATGDATSLSQIIRMVQHAQGAQLPVQSLVNRITLWFVPLILAIAMATVAVWLWIGPTPSVGYALVAGVSVLIIACPCAMGLATPTSIMVGTGRAAELGVLFRKGDALQRLETVRAVAFDKTGTLTQGKPTVTDIHTFVDWASDDVLRIAATVEAVSEHPLARAIVASADLADLTVPDAEAFQSHTGAGVSAMVQEHSVVLGTQQLMQDRGIGLPKVLPQPISGETMFYVAVDGICVGAICLSDPIKRDAAQAIADLKMRGIAVAMITGDREDTAQAIAAQLGIEYVTAAVLPDGKLAALSSLQDRYGTVAFVGDGINDAPALAQADVGVAIGSGTDVAIESADVVLIAADVQGVVAAQTLSRAVMRNIRQNLAWAFGYNVALIPVAAGVFFPLFGVLLSPMFAAGAMALSSVCVLTNALRLRSIT
ncbi:heavy metal translocating P-type ATPase [Algirhabdus cladophorae]|uniref:heavy metal translocating P-type ATPase n=1 Tax=Algirhabdus cladophorae TaxID=3377108 RepID=UPI003B84B01A